MPPLPPYDQAFLRRQAAITRRILKIYEDGINYLVPTLNVIKHNGRLFRLSDYPVLKKKVDQMAGKLQNQVYSTLVNGVKDSWDWANKKNDVLVDKRLAGSRLKKKVRQALYEPNDAALRRFIERKEKGLDLSARVWKTVDPFKKELEQGLGIGIGKGESAQEMARELKKNLRDPDRLFRRVRGEDGKLHLSAAARAFHPGQGVYRSSFKNALRLTRTETNMAYRTSDHERWKGLPFVTGIQVKLSSAHPKYDICDHLAGKYPKDFKFVGWHPQCLCFAIPEMLSDEEYEKLEDQILAGEPTAVPADKLIQQPPVAFKKYLEDNKEKLAGLKSEPYWMRDNKGFLYKRPASASAFTNPIIKERLEPVAKYILERLPELEMEANGINYSSTSYGNSLYVYARDKSGSVIKIRTSDHSVGDQRMRNEVHLNDKNMVDKWFEKMEKTMFPERFKIDESRILTQPNLKIGKSQLLENDQIIGEFTTKKGDVGYIVNRYTIIKKYKR